MHRAVAAAVAAVPALGAVLGFMGGTAACVQAPLPDELAIACAADDECPTAFRCQLAGNCVPVEDFDATPPALVDATVTPAVARLTQRVDVVIEPSEALSAALLRLDVAGAALPPFDDAGDGDPLTFSYAVSGSEPAGVDVEVVADLVDVAGNAALGLLAGVVRFDLTVPACGDNIVDPGEDCDDGAANGLAAGCLPDCSAAACGDGFVRAGVESCDDANDNPNDGCHLCGVPIWASELVLGLGVSEGDPLRFLVDFVSGMGIDRDGNLFVADLNQGRVFRYDVGAGIVTLFAGNGATASTGDGGAATAAGMQPRDVAVDGTGEAIIIDDRRLRRVDGNGAIRAFAGTGDFGSGGAGDGGPAAAARFNRPRALAIDGLGNVFVVDELDDRVRRVDAQTGLIATVAGSTNGFSGDGGAATSARLATPRDVAVDVDGTLYIADAGNCRVRVVDPVSGQIDTLFHDAGAVAGCRDEGCPTGLALVDDGVTLAVAEEAGFCVLSLDRGSGAVLGVDDPFRPEVIVATPAPDNDVWYAPQNRVRSARDEVDVLGGGVLGGVGELPTAAASLDGVFLTGGDAVDVVIDGAGRLTYAPGSPGISQRVSLAGTMEIVFGSASSAGVVAVDIEGRSWFGGSVAANTPYLSSPDASLGFGFGGGAPGDGDGGPANDAGIGTVRGLCFAPADGGAGSVVGAGDVFFTADETTRIRRIDAVTLVVTTFAGTGSAGFTVDGDSAFGAALDQPADLVCDDDGGVTFIEAGPSSRLVRRIDPVDGTLSTLAGPFADAGDIARDADGILYVADPGAGVVVRVDAPGPGAAGVVVAGGGALPEDEGDGGPALDVALTPLSLTFDADDGGALLIGTPTRIARVDVDGDGTGDGTITTVLGGIHPRGLGELGVGRALASPEQLALVDIDGPDGELDVLAAGGAAGVLERARLGDAQAVDVAAGHARGFDVAGVARAAPFVHFDDVAGVAWDPASFTLYLSDRGRNQLAAALVGDPLAPATWDVALLCGAPDGAAGDADGACNAGARFDAPSGLALTPDGAALLVADRDNHVVRRIELTTRTVSTFAGTARVRGFAGDGGAAVDALLHAPEGVAVDVDDNVLIADTQNHRVRRVRATTGIIESVIGDGNASTAAQGTPARDFSVDTPVGLAFDSFGNLFVTSQDAVRVIGADTGQIVDGSGAALTIYGADRTSFPERVTRCIRGVALQADDTVVVSDACLGFLVAVHRFDP